MQVGRGGAEGEGGRAESLGGAEGGGRRAESLGGTEGGGGKKAERNEGKVCWGGGITFSFSTVKSGALYTLPWHNILYCFYPIP